MTRGLVLLAHGARDPAWADPFTKVLERVRQCAPAAAVRLAFLELMSPSLESAARELLQIPCTRIDVVPLFLGMGGHVRRDVPAQVAQLQRAHPEVAWTLHRAVGETELVISALADAAAALSGLGPDTATGRAGAGESG